MEIRRESRSALFGPVLHAKESGVIKRGTRKAMHFCTSISLAVRLEVWATSAIKVEAKKWEFNMLHVILCTFVLLANWLPRMQAPPNCPTGEERSRTSFHDPQIFSALFDRHGAQWLNIPLGGQPM